MKNRNLVKKEYLTKIKELNEHNHYYYEKSTPKISDAEYDKLKKDIVELEKKYSFLKSKNSPSLLVGAKPSKNFLKSNGEARRSLKENSISVNKEKVNENKVISSADLIGGKYVLLQKGKRNYFILKVD